MRCLAAPADVPTARIKQAMADAVAKHHESAEESAFQRDDTHYEEKSRSCAGKRDETEHEPKQRCSEITA